MDGGDIQTWFLTKREVETDHPIARLRNRHDRIKLKTQYQSASVNI